MTKTFDDAQVPATSGQTLYDPHHSVLALLNAGLPNDSRQNLEYSRPEEVVVNQLY